MAVWSPISNIKPWKAEHSCGERWRLVRELLIRLGPWETSFENQKLLVVLKKMRREKIVECAGAGSNCADRALHTITVLCQSTLAARGRALKDWSAGTGRMISLAILRMPWRHDIMRYRRSPRKGLRRIMNKYGLTYSMPIEVCADCCCLGNLCLKPAFSTNHWASGMEESLKGMLFAESAIRTSFV